MLHSRFGSHITSWRFCEAEAEYITHCWSLKGVAWDLEKGPKRPILFWDVLMRNALSSILVMILMCFLHLFLTSTTMISLWNLCTGSLFDVSRAKLRLAWKFLHLHALGQNPAPIQPISKILAIVCAFFATTRPGVDGVVAVYIVHENMYVYIYIHMHACMHACMYVYIYIICICICIWLCICTCMFTYTHAHIPICMLPTWNIYIYIYVYVQIQKKYIYIYTCQIKISKISRSDVGNWYPSWWTSSPWILVMPSFLDAVPFSRISSCSSWCKPLRNKARSIIWNMLSYHLTKFFLC